MAITEAQLEAANNTLIQMSQKVSVLREYVQIAFQGEIRGIILVSAQKQELKDKYQQEKSGLLALYNQLP